MLKVTIANVTKLSEDALLIQMADMKESDPMYGLIESELDRRADLLIKAEKARLSSKIESLNLTMQIQFEIAAFFDGFRGKKTLMLIENFGQEFIEDYVLDEETFTVYSKVSCENFNNQSSWELDSIREARGKMAQLIYYRIYNKFMRTPTQENLEILKRVLGG